MRALLLYALLDACAERNGRVIVIDGTIVFPEVWSEGAYRASSDQGHSMDFGVIESDLVLLKKMVRLVEKVE